jgi:hypothetical protein
MTRYPRVEIKRFPRNQEPIDITKEDIIKATSSNGSVDLDKIRKVKLRREGERRERAKLALKTRHENEIIFDLFQREYKKYFGVEFVPFKQNRIVSYKDASGNLIRRRFKTDYNRFLEFYFDIRKQFTVNAEILVEYFRYAFNRALNEFQFNKQTKIFGLVLSREIANEYFMTLAKKQIRQQKRNKREEQRQRHAHLFKKNA